MTLAQGAKSWWDSIQFPFALFRSQDMSWFKAIEKWCLSQLPHSVIEPMILWLQRNFLTFGLYCTPNEKHPYFALLCYWKQNVQCNMYILIYLHTFWVGQICPKYIWTDLTVCSFYSTALHADHIFCFNLATTQHNQQIISFDFL